jgi:hypothetical protein
LWITKALAVDSIKNTVKIKAEGGIMINQNIKLFLVTICIASTAFSAVKKDDENILQELTGESRKKSLSVQTLPEKHLLAGDQAFKNKDYIKALKHYNTVIIKHNKLSKDKVQAYLSKAELYQQIGLTEQAKYNVSLAKKSKQNIK